MIKWLQDSYNGLYKVLLEPVTPRRRTVLALVVGVLLGLMWAYLIAPVVFYDADPNSLHQSWQDEWVKLLADRNAAANADISQEITLMLRQVDDPVGIVNRLLNDPAEAERASRLNAILPFAEVAQNTAATAPQPNLVGSILPWIVAPLVIAIIFVIVAWLWNLFIYPNLIEPIRRRRANSGAPADEGAARARQEAEMRRQAEATQKTDFSVSQYGKPLMQRMSVYIPGRGQFDDSFSIEDEEEKFLGECGAGISEVIGTGDPANVTAIEAWLFDKDDFVRTITHVFASEHAYNDPGLRAKLEPKGPVVLARPGAITTLETASLRLQARIVELEYGDGPLPPNSYFRKLTVELAAWRKVAGGQPAVTAPAPVPVAAASVPTPSFTPVSTPAPIMPPPVSAPPVTTVSSPLPQDPTFGAVQPQRPLTPPPVISPPPRPTVEDDDPFGGTGDFDPVH
ncbi:MAG: hypothetical protein IT320_09220 [Anaerolineae bacterium]|nr:hypothetical protein [Anaerolineae bacterium]